MENRAFTTNASEFSVGSVFSRTWSTLFRRPGVFIGITLVAWVPSTILRFILGTGQPFTTFMTYVVAYILGMIVQGAISYAALQELRGDIATMGESLAQSASRIAPLLGASLLAGLGLVLGMILLIAPGLILMCAWAVVTPACVVERLGPLKSLRRSDALTKGYRWKIFGLIMLVGIVSGVIGFVAAFATGLIFPWSKMIVTLVSSLVTLLPQTFGCLMNPVIYYSLRSTKEGVAIDSLVNVFD